MPRNLTESLGRNPFTIDTPPTAQRTAVMQQQLITINTELIHLGATPVQPRTPLSNGDELFWCVASALQDAQSRIEIARSRVAKGWPAL